MSHGQLGDTKKWFTSGLTQQKAQNFPSHYIMQRQRDCPASWEKFIASFTVHSNFNAFILASAGQH